MLRPNSYLSSFHTVLQSHKVPNFHCRTQNLPTSKATVNTYLQWVHSSSQFDGKKNNSVKWLILSSIWGQVIHFKSTNSMQWFLQFITWRLFTARHVSGVLMPIIRSPTTAVAASGFIFGVWWYQCCWSWSSRLTGPDYDQQHCYHHAPTVNPEAATAVVGLLMMGVRTPETCRAVN